MAKSLFNFYLDDELKAKAIEKLNRLNGEQTKGQLASLLRVMVMVFVNTPDEQVDKDLLDVISLEYEYSSKLNKRSRL